jgi:predicted nucleic acid-binding protein
MAYSKPSQPMCYSGFQMRATNQPSFTAEAQRAAEATQRGRRRLCVASAALCASAVNEGSTPKKTRKGCTHLKTAVRAQQQLFHTQNVLNKFTILQIDGNALALIAQLQKQIRARKRHADFLIAAQTLAGRHILVTRNTKDFVDIIPGQQLQNWIDERVG